MYSALTSWASKRRRTFGGIQSETTFKEEGRVDSRILIMFIHTGQNPANQSIGGLSHYKIFTSQVVLTPLATGRGSPCKRCYIFFSWRFWLQRVLSYDLCVWYLPTFKLHVPYIHQWNVGPSSLGSLAKQQLGFCCIQVTISFRQQALLRQGWHSETLISGLGTSCKLVGKRRWWLSI